jgi:Glycosyltransferase sugar-binding region containing DXD motif
VLVPGAFKCDFWRYAILYVNGGVYLDMDIKPLYPFRDILTSTDTFVSVADKEHGVDMTTGIYQAFIACKPKHPILLYALQLSFANIVTRRITLNTLDITGPTVMGVAFNLYLNNEKTYTKIKSGDYGDGTRLFRMNAKHTFDLEGKVIFNNKFDAYDRGSNDYSLVIRYYKDNPLPINNFIVTVVIRYRIVILVVLVAILIILYRKRCKSK